MRFNWEPALAALTDQSIRRMLPPRQPRPRACSLRRREAEVRDDPERPLVYALLPLRLSARILGGYDKLPGAALSRSACGRRGLKSSQTCSAIIWGRAAAP